MKFPLATGIAIFAYNRPSHLKRVLIALEDYKINNATIFVDGPKGKKDRICQEEILFMIKTNKNINSKQEKILLKKLHLFYQLIKFNMIIGFVI